MVEAGGVGWSGVEWSGVEWRRGVGGCLDALIRQEINGGGGSQQGILQCPVPSADRGGVGWGLPNIQIKRAGGSSVWSVFVTSSVHPLHPVGETKGLGSGKFYFFSVITCYDGFYTEATLKYIKPTCVSLALACVSEATYVVNARRYEMTT